MRNPVHIAIRVDASSTMGTGHLKRCLSLEAALTAAGAQVRFVVRMLDPVAPQMLQSLNCRVHWLAKPGASRPSAEPGPDQPPHAAWAEVNWCQDANETIEALDEWAVDWLVVDHYAFDARWHQTVRRALGCKLLVIDDTADRSIDADALLDHNWHTDHQKKYQGRLTQEPHWLVGPRFALLAPVYATAPRYAFHTEVRSMGIFMGGTDPGAASARALKACRVAGFRGPIEVVSTSANPLLRELRAACASLPPTQLTLDQPDLAAFFARHDLQIGAGGGATWERCCIGAPTIGLVLSANQSAVVPLLDRQGVLRSARLDGAASPDGPLLSQVLRELFQDAETRQRLAQNAQALVDGLGARRVAFSLLIDTMSLRPARIADAALLHSWRNHPSVRAVSGNTEPIALANHQSWLHRVLQADNRWLFVALVGCVPVGSIRFDQLDSGDLEVSLYLDPALAGLGLGSHLLRTGEETMRDTLKADFLVLASVAPGNTASQRLFEGCGYHGGPLRFQKAVSAPSTASPARS
jgi:UDP-2,4-diacetamido-2,4,6-trideoxy-beta-L-altropyranose hydrolase